jgi:hypothetical protein
MISHNPEKSDRWDGTNHDQLASDIFNTLDTVIVLALAERLRVDVGGKVAHGGSDALVESTAESEMAAETHSCGANTAVASLHAGEEVDAQSGIFVVCRELLLDFPCVSGVSARAVVGECLWAGELVVAAGCCDDVAVGCNLAGEALDWAGDLGCVSWFDQVGGWMDIRLAIRCEDMKCEMTVLASGGYQSRSFLYAYD